MPKLILVCFVIGLLLASPPRAMCAGTPLCELGASVIEQMNLQLIAGGKIDPTALTGSIAFVEECPSTVIPAFRRFADNEQKLRHSWIDALKSGSQNPNNTELNEFLAAAKRNVDHDGNVAFKVYFDGIFETSRKAQGRYQPTVGHLFEQESLTTLKQFPRCDGAECYDVSDFLLFLLGTHPNAFFRAMHADEADATKWLSQLGELSFAGDPSESRRRDSIRRFLLQKISKLQTNEFLREKYQCEDSLRQIRFRAWQ
jgi:hypothetical protein